MKIAPRPSVQPKAHIGVGRRKKSPDHSIEYFHIYTDEVISGRHQTGLEYLRTIEKTWSFDYNRVILIDNYNPVEHRLTATDVLKHLKKEGMMPHHWAYEGDLIRNAEVLLEAVTNAKLKKQYLNYIKKNGKYPCSLLTATWYLTRLGYLDPKGIIKSSKPWRGKYVPAKRLLNLLPEDYKSVEERARAIILKSEFAEAADKVQDLFYPVDSGRALDLF